MLQVQSTSPAPHVSHNRIRPEIQGLRAVAVGIVTIFHLWPSALPGGYVGVDVFFVISGFLITGVLVREAERTQRIDMLTFYGRRARRLLPAAGLVLLVVAALMQNLLPASLWEDTAIDVIASVFYMQNWRLAAQATDYLAAENVASPVQHYWSLSVEEQFYIVWPLLIVAGSALAGALRRPARRVLLVTFVAVFCGSLALSIWQTMSAPESAYFATHTRAWELCLGGLIALREPILTNAFRRGLSAVSLLAIVVAALMYSAKTAFPGYAALLPTVGAAGVIVAGDSSGFGVSRLLSTKAFQFLGDVSYSVYLWHWPLIVLVRHENESMGLVSGVCVLIAAIALAHLTKVYVEDPFRQPSSGRPRARRAAWIAASMAAPALVSGGIYGCLATDAAAETDVEAYPGARAVYAEAPVPEVDSPLPSIAALKRDRSDVYDNGCHLGFKAVDPVACHYGDPKGAKRVLLIGDSHAANWIPAYEEVARQRGWNASSLTKSSCALMPVMLKRSGKAYKECFDWGQRVLDLIRKEKPELVILAQMHIHKVDAETGSGAPSMQEALAQLWREIEETGARVVAIADTPRWEEDPDLCLSKDPNCALEYSKSGIKDPLVAAQAKNRHIALVDFNDVICPNRRCPAVIGNVIAWRDKHHLTATYARSMAEVFGRRIEQALQR